LLEANAILQELFENVQRILGEKMIGIYLDGSLLSGSFALPHFIYPGEWSRCLKTARSRVGGDCSGWTVE